MELKIKYIPVEDLEPYAGNARAHGEEDIEAIKKSIQKYGFNDPVGIWSDHNVIVEGHGRLQAAKELGLEEIPCIRLDHLTDEERREYGILHNKTAELSAWDMEALEKELSELSLSGFEELFEEIKEEGGEERDEGLSGSLEADFIVPPFSVLDCRSGRWNERKKLWHEKVSKLAGRKENLLSLSHLRGEGTSIFDPVLCEVAYRWFAIAGGLIFDPFAGGSVRGIVASLTGHDYIGIDLSTEQVETNKREAEALGLPVVWHCDDSLNMDKYIKDESADMVFTCPPYADLEVYSDDPRDISNMEYKDFKRVYAEILKKASRKLKENRFMAIVVGEVRDPQGVYRGFINLTEKVLEEAGLLYYNEFIKLDPIGDASYRARRIFRSRKCTKVHQQMLVFYKGDPKEIPKHFPELKAEEEQLNEFIEQEGSEA